MSLLDPLRINIQNNTADNNTADNNTTDNNTADNNTADSTAAIYTAYSDLEHGVNGIHYQHARELRRIEIIHEGSRTMKDIAVVVLTTACVLIYLGLFFAMARFFV